MEEKEKTDYVPRESIAPQGRLERRVGYNPILRSLMVTAFGAAVLLTGQPIIMVLGALLIAASLLSLVLVPDHKVLEIYSGGVVSYQKSDDGMAMYLPYDQISEWSAHQSEFGNQVVLLVLDDGQYVYQETYRLRGVRAALKKHMPEKEFIPPKQGAR